MVLFPVQVEMTNTQVQALQQRRMKTSPFLCLLFHFNLQQSEAHPDAGERATNYIEFTGSLITSTNNNPSTL